MKYLKNLTMGFILASVIIIALFDCYVFIRGGTEATISYTINQWSHEFPIMVFSVGVVMGHLFWRTRELKKDKKE